MALWGCVAVGGTPDPDQPTPAPVISGEFEWGDALVCDDPYAGWDGRFVEEGQARGLTQELAGMWGGEVFEGFATVAVSDLDLDGDLDLVFGQVMGSPLAYLNDGTGGFTAGPLFTLASGVDPGDTGHLLAIVDLDGDPFPEVVVLGTVLEVYDDMADGSFQPPTITEFAGTGMHSALSLADVDGDGDLDAAVATYRDLATGTVYPELLLEYDDGFTVVREVELAAVGVDAQLLLFTDRDFDNQPDLFVLDGAADPQHPTVFFSNDGGVLTDEAASLGVTVPMHGMGIDSWDWNGDGWLDYCITDVGPAVCFLSAGGGYVDATAAVGLSPAEPAYPPLQTIGWSLDAVDLNHDGLLDVVQASAVDNGSPSPPGERRFPDLLWAGTEDGGFEDRTADAGFGTDDAHFGLAAADFDGDGAQDVVVVGPGMAPLLYMNRCQDGWIELELVGPPGNADAIGAIGWVNEEPRELYGPRTYGQRASRLHFGLGSSEPVAVRILWPDGHLSESSEVPVDRLVTVRHPDAD